MIHIIGGLLIGLWLWWHMSDNTRKIRSSSTAQAIEDEWVVDIIDEEIEADEAE